MLTTTSETQYFIALTLLKNVGSITARKLIAHFGTAQMVFEATTKELLKIPGVGHSFIREIKNALYLHEALKIIQICQKQEVYIIIYSDDNYPHRLKSLYDAPLVLYFLGSEIPNSNKTLAVVGTRMATDYGKKVVGQLVSESKNTNANFISGLAYGIDICMHVNCIENQITNYAILAGGFDHIYPFQHKKYIDRILQNGGLIAEHPPSIKPDARYFPMRNRIIAGLSDALIVVEAAQRGGALITADFANNYHKEVFAVPGNLDRPFSMGCNQLIANNKAIVYLGFEELMNQMNWSRENDLNFSKQIELDFSKFTQNESAILAAIHQFGDLSIDELVWKTNLTSKEIALICLSLECDGLIKAIPGNRYMLI